MLRKDCFAYRKTKDNIFCCALTKMECGNCNFFLTADEYARKLVEMERKRQVKEKE